MGSDLNWNVDERDREPPWRAPPVQAEAPRPRPWRLMIAVLLLLAVTVAGVLWLLNRARAAEAEQRAVITGLAENEERLARAGDMEALGTLADGLYAGWREWQISRREPRLHPLPAGGQWYGLAWGSTPLNWHVAAGDPTYGEFHLEGDAATLEMTHYYEPLPERPGDAPFALRHTAYYRFANGVWVHTEPPVEVWSAMVAASDTGLQLLVPAHDVAALEPLIPRMTALAARACKDLGCTAAPHMILSARVEDLLQSHPRGVDAPAYAPALALIGTPSDDAGYDAVFRYYGIRLVTHIVESAAPEDAAALANELAGLELEQP